MPVQAKLLVWADLNRQQVEHLLRLSAKASDVPTLRKTVGEYMGLQDVGRNHEQAALEDLYFNTIQFAWKQGFPEEKASAFFSIMKRTHFDAVGSRLTLKKSFAAFRELLLAHSVQRPPYSVGLFSLHDVQVLTDYAVSSYFRHFKLYQYAFTSRVTLSLATRPAVALEYPPALRPLATAVTQEEWQGERDKYEEERQVARKRQDEELLAQAEVAREAAIRAAYDGTVPEDMEQRVQASVAEKLGAMKAAMEERFQQKEAGLLDQVAQLESKAAAVPR